MSRISAPSCPVRRRAIVVPIGVGMSMRRPGNSRWASIHVGGVAGFLVFDFEESEHRRPFQNAIGPPRLRPVEYGGARKHILGWHQKVGLCRYRIDLRAA